MFQAFKAYKKGKITREEMYRYQELHKLLVGDNYLDETVLGEIDSTEVDAAIQKAEQLIRQKVADIVSEIETANQ